MHTVYITTFNTHPVCVDTITSALKRIGIPPDHIRQITTEVALQTLLEDAERNSFSSPATLVFPGSDNAMKNIYEYQENPDQAALLKKAIANGWSYFGSCAGGHLGAATIQLRLAVTQPYTTSEKTLGLLNADGYSFIFPRVKSLTQGGDNGQVLQIATKTDQIISMYWNEGPRFACTSPDIHPIAHYTTLPEGKNCAGISGLYGKGRVVLLGVHPEIDDHNGTPIPQKEERYAFLKELFQYLGTLPYEEIHL